MGWHPLDAGQPRVLHHVLHTAGEEEREELHWTPHVSILNMRAALSAKMEADLLVDVHDKDQRERRHQHLLDSFRVAHPREPSLGVAVRFDWTKLRVLCKHRVEADVSAPEDVADAAVEDVGSDNHIRRCDHPGAKPAHYHGLARPLAIFGRILGPLIAYSAALVSRVGYWVKLEPPSVRFAQHCVLLIFVIHTHEQLCFPVNATIHCGLKLRRPDEKPRLEDSRHLPIIEVSVSASWIFCDITDLWQGRRKGNHTCPNM
eukprot:2310342-Rhodomonas_salina.2